MNKPILVTSQAEWLRLAPVLEKQGYFWRGNGKISDRHHPEKSIFFKGYPIVINVGDKEDMTWEGAVLCQVPTQSVDEYLASQEPLFKLPENANPILEMIYHEAMKDPDYKALYENQTRAVQEALDEIEKIASLYASQRLQFQKGYSEGLEKAKEILTQKLK